MRSLYLFLPVAALSWTSCQPLNGVDPLDSGELAAEAMPISTSIDGLDQRRASDERMERYDLGGLQVVDPDPELRVTSGIDARSDF
ncbi:hypothetical protein HNR46_000011 [Haloferula luteola]|uniref:Uncharacterized protein n=1 Tax=Haloferula luteola TaxID=595692 RepID=A0A840V764_9BACT|nr:hypothetical protein [Haloferula luteola]MBB5349790.1 hypothetical protein [Haloferula luteola]